MIRYVYGIPIPKLIESRFSLDSIRAVTDDYFGFHDGYSVYLSEDGYGPSEPYVIYGQEKGFSRLKVEKIADKLKWMNSLDADSISEKYQENLSEVLKLWLEAYGSIVSDDNFWEDMTEEQKEETLGKISLPDAIELDWFIVQVKEDV